MTNAPAARRGRPSRGRCAPSLPIVVGLLAAGPAAAQAPPQTLPPGARVRVEAPALGPGRVVRRLSAQRGDTLFLLPDRRAGVEAAAVPLADVRTLEVSRGRRRRALAGAAVGFVAGAAGGAVYGYNAAEPEPEPGCFIFCFPPDTTRDRRPQNRGGYATSGALLGASYGAALGALVGRFVVRERWAAVSVAGTRVGVHPHGAGARVVVTGR